MYGCGEGGLHVEGADNYHHAGGHEYYDDNGHNNGGSPDYYDPEYSEYQQQQQQQQRPPSVAYDPVPINDNYDYDDQSDYKPSYQYGKYSRHRLISPLWASHFGLIKRLVLLSGGFYVVLFNKMSIEKWSY